MSTVFIWFCGFMVILNVARTVAPTARRDHRDADQSFFVAALFSVALAILIK